MKSKLFSCSGSTRTYLTFIFYIFGKTGQFYMLPPGVLGFGLHVQGPERAQRVPRGHSAQAKHGTNKLFTITVQ